MTDHPDGPAPPRSGAVGAPGEVLPLHSDRTHLFPGARIRAGIPDVPTTMERSLEATLLFADGSRADARLRADEGALILDVGPYRTEAGTDIPAKSWGIRTEADGTWVAARRPTTGPP